MLLKPYNVMDDESHNPFELRHIGKVVDNNDPERRKRVKVLIEPWSYLETENLPWVKQEGDGTVGCSPDESHHHIPEVNSDVTVYFKNADPDDPVYTGVETTEANRCTLFDEGYPNSYGDKDSAGNYEVVNKESKTTVRQYASGTSVRAEADGTYVIETSSGNYIMIDGDGVVWLKGPKIKIYAEDDIDMRATRINITASNGLTMNGSNVTMTGVNGTKINGGAIAIQSKSSTILKGATTIDDLIVTNGASGQLIDLMNPGNIFTFHNGILSSVTV